MILHLTLSSPTSLHNPHLLPPTVLLALTLSISLCVPLWPQKWQACLTATSFKMDVIVPTSSLQLGGP